MTRTWPRFGVVCLMVLSACGPANVGGGSENNEQSLLLASLEAERMGLGKYDSVIDDASASGGAAVRMLGSSALTATISSEEANLLTVVARGTSCSGAPHLEARVDGALVLSVDVASATWASYSGTSWVKPGTHAVQISFTNDLYKKGVCDRNLFVDVVRQRFNVGIASGNHVSNPSFETGVTGWVAKNAALGRAADLDAPDGNDVATLTYRGTTGSYELDTASDLTPLSTAGQTYYAAAWVRARSTSAVGKPVQVFVRETGAKGTTIFPSKAVWLTTEYQRVGLNATASQTGASLGIYVQQTAAVAGDSIDLDDVTLAY